jgi:4-alpha-glucanotransferase
LETGLRSADAFALRCCQILLASARGQHATAIGQNLGCDDETVRRVIKTFNARGLKVLEAGSRRPHHPQAAFSTAQAEQLKEMLHKSPRAYGKDTSLWT